MDAGDDAVLHVTHVGRSVNHLTVHAAPGIFPMRRGNFDALNDEVLEDLVERGL